MVTGHGPLRNAGESAVTLCGVSERPTQTCSDCGASAASCPRSNAASRSCGHRCCGFRVVGTGRCQIHALVFFLVTHDPAPRLGANMGGGRLTDRIDEVRRGSAVSRRVACATMAVPRVGKALRMPVSTFNWLGLP